RQIAHFRKCPNRGYRVTKRFYTRTQRLRRRHHSTAPATTDTALTACAFDIPKKERGLMRMNSTRNRAPPVVTKYAAKISPCDAITPLPDSATAIRREPIRHNHHAIAHAARNS